MSLNIPLLCTKTVSTISLFILTIFCCYAPWILKHLFSHFHARALLKTARKKGDPTLTSASTFTAEEIAEALKEGRDRVSKKWKNVMSYLYCLAGGVVLGALLLHMIPEITGHAGHDHGSHASKKNDHPGHPHHHHEHGHSHDHADHGHSNPSLSHGSQHHGALFAALNPSLSAVAPGSATMLAQDGTNVSRATSGDSISLATAKILNSQTTPKTNAISANDNDKEHDHCEHHPYPFGPLFAGLSFLLLLFLDRLFLSHEHIKDKKKKAKNDVSSTTAMLEHDPELGHCCNHNHDHPGDEDSLDHLKVQLEAVASAESIDVCSAGGCQVDGIAVAASQSVTSTFIFVIALSVHSFMEGLGMASKNQKEELMAFLISLFAHKWIEAFALGASVMQAEFGKLLTFFVLLAYSALTPIGILLGILLDAFFKSHYADSKVEILEGVFNGAAVGSFMFVACVEMIPPQFGHGMPVNRHAYGRFLTVLFGYGVMAVVSARHSH